MASKQKTKGNSFERKIAKKFTEWSGFAWRKTFGSGNMRFKTRSLNEIGDLKSEREVPFVIECKFHKDLSYSKIMKGDCGKLDNWILEMESDQKRSKKLGLLIFKTNLSPIFVLLSPRYNRAGKREHFKNINNLRSRNFVDYKGRTIVALDNLMKQPFEVIL